MRKELNRRQFLDTATKISGALIAAAQLIGNSVKAEPPLANAALASTESDIKRLKTLLILDRESVAAADQVTFQLNHATKHPENPILIPGEPNQWDSLQVIWPGTVLYDADEKLFRCWYSGMTAIQSEQVPRWRPGYAESKDGIHWTKRGRIQFPENEYYVLSLVLRNPDVSQHERKFLALFNAVDVGDGRMGKWLASSADGFSWVKEKTAYTASAPTRAAFQDISQLVLVPDAQDPEFRVLGYAQLMQGGTRTIGLVHGPDMGNLQDMSLKPILAPEAGIDEEIHFASVARVGETFLMLFESDRFSKNRGDLRLAMSQDGKAWRRVHPETPLVSTGEKGMWDENILVTTTAAMQEVGDEIWIFYFGCPNVFVNWPQGGANRGSLFYPTYLGLAILPRDRYAYAAGPGSVTTPRLSIGKQGLWLNADGDGIVVSAIDSAGTPLAEGRVAGSTEKPGYRHVQWNTELPRQPIQLRVDLHPNQRLYSLRYSQE